MPNPEKSYTMARYQNSGTVWMPVAPEARFVDMARDDGQTVRFKLASNLVSQATGRSTSDKWKCSLTVAAEHQADVSEPFHFDYSVGVGHRTRLRGGPSHGDLAPTEPTCRSVLVSLASDASVALDMPMDLKRAAAYVQAEFGFERADEAIAVVEKLRDSADRLRAVLGHVGVGMEEFAAFGLEIEAMPPKPQGRDGFDIALPVTHKDGEEFKAVVRVELSTIKRAAIDVDGNAVPPGMRRLSMTASVLSRHGGKGRWQARSTGQSVDLLREAWSDHPVVAEMCDIWERWHLNDMKAGSRAQSEAVQALRLGGGDVGYDASVEHLKNLGLETDASVQVGAKPYRYGTAWLVEPLPASVEDRLREMRADVACERPAPEASGPRI
jgi:hypothetical protein